MTELKSVRATAQYLRKDFQRKKALILRHQMQLRGIKSNNYIKELHQREKPLKHHGNIQRVLKKKFGASVYELLNPDESEYPPGTNIFDIEKIWKRISVNDGNDIMKWKKIDNCKVVEQLLLKWQKRYFEQVLETPLAQYE